MEKVPCPFRYLHGFWSSSVFLQRRVGDERGDPEAWGFSYDVMEGNSCGLGWCLSLSFGTGLDWTGILQGRYLGTSWAGSVEVKAKAQAEKAQARMKITDE
jgi:hypothetical protein